MAVFVLGTGVGSKFGMEFGEKRHLVRGVHSQRVVGGQWGG